MSIDATAPVSSGVTKTLCQEFDNEFPFEAIERLVSESVSEFSNARIREFVPLLVYRLTRQRLMDMRLHA